MSQFKKTGVKQVHRNIFEYELSSDVIVLIMNNR